MREEIAVADWRQTSRGVMEEVVRLRFMKGWKRRRVEEW